MDEADGLTDAAVRRAIYAAIGVELDSPGDLPAATLRLLDVAASKVTDYRNAAGEAEAREVLAQVVEALSRGRAFLHSSEMRTKAGPLG
jgi:hypothetical protein